MVKCGQTDGWPDERTDVANLYKSRGVISSYTSAFTTMMLDKNYGLYLFILPEPHVNIPVANARCFVKCLTTVTFAGRYISPKPQPAKYYMFLNCICHLKQKQQQIVMLLPFCIY